MGKTISRNFIYTRTHIDGNASLFKAYTPAGVMVASVEMPVAVVDDLFGVLTAWKRPDTDDDGTCADIPPKRVRR